MASVIRGQHENNDLSYSKKGRKKTLLYQEDFERNQFAFYLCSARPQETGP